MRTAAGYVLLRTLDVYKRQELSQPLGTITTKDRFGLANVITDINDEQYILKDIFLRMLKPEELKRMKGFPDDYIIDRDIEGKLYPIRERVARIGNLALIHI